ncbi:MAG: hypothetical protein R3C26_20110 [Calditrichia bacterium]
MRRKLFTARAEASEHANALALGRMNRHPLGRQRRQFQRLRFRSVRQIDDPLDGAIPDELRRGSVPAVKVRQSKKITANRTCIRKPICSKFTAHAELSCSGAAITRIYDNIQPEALRIEYYDPNGNPLAVELPAVRGSLLKAIELCFRNENPVPRSLKSAGEVAYRYYSTVYFECN